MLGHPGDLRTTSNWNDVSRDSSLSAEHSGTPEVAVVSSVISSEDGCSSAAVITAVWQSRYRAVATIYAKIINADHIVKCDVIVDDIHRIEITTTTQELYLHNTPVSLVVTAYDEYGNTFSSLEGVPFEWRIFEDKYEELGDVQGVLRFITWSESEYTTPSTMALLESKGLQGYMQLISGLRTGSAVVSVALYESIYKNVVPSQVRLLVMANAQLSPALAYLIPNSFLTFTVHVIQQGDDQEVSMPSLQYHLQVNDTNLAVLSPLDGSTLKALDFGQTEVTLLDRNVEEALEKLDEVLNSKVDESDLRLPKRRRPTSLIQIVEPAYLGFTLIQKSTNKKPNICQLASLLNSRSYVSQVTSGSYMPIRRWIMESGQVYVINVDIYDRNNHRLYPSDNLRISLHFPESHFEILQSSLNQTYVTVRASESGSVSLKAILRGVVDEDGSLIEFNSTITGNQDVTIYSAIKIYPTPIILPLSTELQSSNSTRPNPGFQLQANGGCGQYRWIAISIHSLEEYSDTGKLPSYESLTNTVVSITKAGVLSAFNLGESIVVASSSSNPQLCGHTVAYVRSPAEIKFVSGRNEVLIPSRRKSNFMDEASIKGYSNQFDNEEWSVQDPSAFELSLEHLSIGLAVLDSDGQSMIDCRNLNIEIRAIDSNIVKIIPGFHPPRINSSTEYGLFDSNECLHFYVVGVSVGFTEIKAIYNPSPVNKLDNSVAIVSRFHVAAYRKITFIDPVSEQTSFALGSTRSMLVTHGPQPWSLQPSEHYIKVFAQPDSDNDISSLPTLVNQPYFSKTTIYKNTNVEKEAETVRTYDVEQIDSHSRLISFSLRCESIGIFEFVIEIGNRPTSTNLYPMILSSKFTIMCDIAVSLQLVPLFQFPLIPSHYPSCPLVNISSSSWSHDKLILPNTIPTAVRLVFFGSENQELESVDSLTSNVVIFSVDDDETTKHLQLVRHLNPRVHVDYLDFENRNMPYFFITPANFGLSTGSLTVQATVHSGLPDRYTPFLHGVHSLQSTLNAYLSPIVHSVPSQSIKLFYHPEASSTVYIHGGSGHYYLDGSASDLSNIHHYPIRMTEKVNEPTTVTNVMPYIMPRRTYKIQPQYVGRVTIQIIDLCFPLTSSLESKLLNEAYNLSPAQAEFNVDVIGLSALNLRVHDRIQLGDEVTAFIEAIGTDEITLPAKFARLLKLSIISDHVIHSTSTGHKESLHDLKKILSVPETDVPSDSFWVCDLTSLEQPCSGQFTIRGIALGTSRLMVTSVVPGLQSKHVTVQSNIVEIQVFAPLRLFPCNFNLLMGAEYELQALGGPSQASLEFIPESVSGYITVVKANPSSVLIRASKSLGLANVRARAVGITGNHNLSSSSGEKYNDYIIYSETVCSIHIVALSGVHIRCPLANLDEVTSQISDSSNPPFSEFSNSDRSDQYYLLACPPGRSEDCGSTPLWAEGIPYSPHFSENQSRSNIVSPLGMAAVNPPLRYHWHLNPPEPSSVVRLEYWLGRLGIDVDETHLASGMVLVGLKPGTVTIHLTVEPVESNAKQIFALSSDGVSIDRLHASLKIVVLSRLGLSSPPREPQQIILSPNSQLNLIPWADLRSDSILRYKILTAPSTDKNLSLEYPSQLLTVSPDGVLRVNDRCSDSSESICRITLQIQSIPNGNLHISKYTHDFDSSLIQTLILEILIKVPRFMMFSMPSITIPQNEKSSKVTGLPVGGPYNIKISYHDELGRIFNAVSNDFYQLKAVLHRSDLFSTHFIRDFVIEGHFPANNVNSLSPIPPTKFGLSIHSLPLTKTNNDVELIQSTKNIQYTKNSHWVALHIELSNKIVGLSPSYLSLPYSNSLDLLGLTSLVEGQWMCLPALSSSISNADNIWSSVDPSTIWIDPLNHLLLARKPGQGVLAFSLTSSVKINQQSRTLKNATYPSGNTESLTYLLKLKVIPLESYTVGIPSASLILVDSGNSVPHSNELITLPIGVDRRSRSESFLSMLRFLVQLPVKESNNIPCSKTLGSLSTFANFAPFKCQIKLQIDDEFHLDSNYRSSLLPKWFSHLALWEHNETVESILESESAKFSLQRYFTTQLEPLLQSSPFYTASTQWQCVVKAPTEWLPNLDAIALTLLPKTQMILQLVKGHLSANSKQTDNSSIIAQMSLLPLPGIKLLIPPALKLQEDSHMSASKDSYYLWITQADHFTQRLLIFIPPATSSALSMEELGLDKLLVRSQVPNILEVSEPPRPVQSLLEVVDTYKEYSRTLSSLASTTLASYPSSVTIELSNWLHVVHEQIGKIEDDVLSDFNPSILKHKVLWLVRMKCIPSNSPIDTVVNVVVSLRSTGQHIEIPVRVTIPSISQLDGKEIPNPESSFSLLTFSWVHLFAIILITLFIAIIVHIILRSEALISCSNGSNTGKYSSSPLPPLSPTKGGLSRSPPGRQLWSNNFIPGGGTLNTFSTFGGGLRSGNVSSPMYPQNLSPNRSYSNNNPQRVSPRFDLSTSSDLVNDERRWRQALSGGSINRLRDSFEG
ncbi:Nuclear pore membrane glycoprotein [Schistosoma japonicum]|uniref:Nuclear pore membrane glycoprotein n=1 Tax=Schistosoma japonicum TaxID=6182 RepID=A0A4Z2D9F0_SCHJA|nr:Nuclear pore membrane glycoprotein [Schistosoma japonicum]